MPNYTKASTKARRMLTEFESRIENEAKLDKVVGAREDEQSLHDTMPFDCECDDGACDEIIAMSTGEYKRVHDNSKHFVVVPGHVRLDIERVVAIFSNYVLVAKLLPGLTG